MRGQQVRVQSRRMNTSYKIDGKTHTPKATRKLPAKVCKQNLPSPSLDCERVLAPDQCSKCSQFPEIQKYFYSLKVEFTLHSEEFLNVDFSCLTRVGVGGGV